MLAAGSLKNLSKKDRSEAGQMLMHGLLFDSGLSGWCRAASKGLWVNPPHIALIIHEVEEMLTTPGRNLIISAPPRHGKSYTLSNLFPAWYMVTHPDDPVILASYGSDFAASWGRKVRNLITEWSSVTGVDVSRDSSAANRWGIDRHRGEMLSVGVGSGITGRGGKLILLDDYVQDAEQARSKVYRESTWEWWVSTISTRLEPLGHMLIIATRWHEDDLIGRLQAQGDPSWKIINLPALAEEDDVLGREVGEALWEERYSREWLETRRARDGEYWFSALYQGRPSVGDGSVFHREGIRWFTEDEDGNYVLELANGGFVVRKRSDCTVFAMVDLAVSEASSADYTVVGTFAWTKHNELIWLGMARGHFPGPEQMPILEAEYAKYEHDFLGIEAVQYQLAFVQAAQDSGLPAKKIRPKGDKYGRALSGGALWDRGGVYLPKNASWAQTAIEEIISFPKGAHDDIVDVLSYACIEATTTLRGSASGFFGVSECAECGKIYMPTDDDKCPGCGAEAA